MQHFIGTWKSVIYSSVRGDCVLSRMPGGQTQFVCIYRGTYRQNECNVMDVKWDGESGAIQADQIELQINVPAKMPILKEFNDWIDGEYWFADDDRGTFAMARFDQVSSYDYYHQF